VRVSSEKQEQAGSLERQEKRLREEVSQRENIPAKSLPIYSDVASSFGSRKGLNVLVDAMLEGRVKRIYCEYLDRLSRTPALTHLIEHLAKRQGVEIVCLDVEETDPSELEYMTKELIAFITVVSNRVSAMKSRLVTVKEVDEETLTRIIRMRQEGLSLTQVWKRAKKEGLATVKGDALSYYKCKDLLYNGKGQALCEAIGEANVDPQNVLLDFLKTHLQQDDTPKSRVYSDEIGSAYTAFCEKKGMKALAPGDRGRAMMTMFEGRRFFTMGRIAYRNLKIVGE